MKYFRLRPDTRRTMEGRLRPICEERPLQIVGVGHMVEHVGNLLANPPHMGGVAVSGIDPDVNHQYRTPSGMRVDLINVFQVRVSAGWYCKALSAQRMANVQSPDSAA